MGNISLLAIVFSLAGLMALALSIASLRKKRVVGGLSGGLGALVLLLAGLLLGTISISTQGYAALTREELAVTVRTQPSGDQAFDAQLIFPDGRVIAYEFRGDQLYIDAHILKWKPLGNLLGLHTDYELDRVGGRYRTLENERNSPRTIYSVAEEKPLDMFDLRERIGLLSFLLDTEYGSATFVPADQPAHYEILVSTTGLLARRAQQR